MIAVLSLVLCFLLFIIQNTEQVQVAFLFWTISLSRAFILLVTLLLGVSIGLIAGIGTKKGKKTLPRPQVDSEKATLRNKVLKQDAVITKMQSDQVVTKRILETQEASRVEALDHLRRHGKQQRIAETELTTTQVALDNATKTIYSLEDEVDLLRKEIEIKDLVEKIVQHDIRSALIAFVSLPESIIADSNLTEKQKIIVSLIRDSGSKMLQTIDSSLTLYRIEEGTYETEFTTVNLHDVISTVVERLGETHSSFKQNVSIDCMDVDDQENEEFLVYGDEFLLYSSFMNLLTNAYEASPPEKTISITLCRNDYCSVAIRNYGEVPEDIRDTFFNKMTTSGKKFGTGLGTYSAMAMIKVQSGDIELDCSEPGMTTIYVSLPRPR